MTSSVREIVATGPSDPDPSRRPAGRAHTRRILYLAGLLPLLAALAFSAKVFVMLHHDGAGEDAWIRRDGVHALEHYSANRSLNLLEPWIAPFDEGDAAFLLGSYSRSRDLFITALRTVPHHQECTVRINLALTYEAIGDAQARRGALDEATATWQDGITTLADGDCPLHAGLGPRQSQDATTVKKRLESKQSDPNSGGQAPPKTQQQPQLPGGQDRLDRLKQRDQQGDQARRDFGYLKEYGSWGDEPQW